MGQLTAKESIRLGKLKEAQQLSRDEVAQALTELPKLYDQARDVANAWHSDAYLTLGLIEPTDYRVLKRIETVRDEAGTSGRRAADDIPIPDDEVYLELYPPEYADLARRNLKARAVHRHNDAISSILYEVKTHTCIVGLPNVRLAQRLWNSLTSLPSPASDEYYETKDKMTHKQRVGSKYRKVNQAIFNEYDLKRTLASEQATADHLEYYRLLLQREDPIKAKVQRNKETRLAFIAKEIKLLLHSTLKLVGQDK